VQLWFLYEACLAKGGRAASTSQISGYTPEVERDDPTDASLLRCRQLTVSPMVFMHQKTCSIYPLPLALVSRIPCVASRAAQHGLPLEGKFQC